PLGHQSMHPTTTSCMHPSASPPPLLTSKQRALRSTTPTRATRQPPRAKFRPTQDNRPPAQPTPSNTPGNGPRQPIRATGIISKHMASLTDTIEALLWEDESATLDFKQTQ